MNNLDPVSKRLFFFGRLIVGGLFAYSAINNLLYPAEAVGYATLKGVPNPELMVQVAAWILVVSAVSIILGLLPEFGVLAAILFLIPVTWYMHNFWALASGMERTIELRFFQSNAMILGLVLCLLGVPRPWPYSLDQFFRRRPSVKLLVE